MSRQATTVGDHTSRSLNTLKDIFRVIRDPHVSMEERQRAMLKVRYVAYNERTEAF